MKPSRNDAMVVLTFWPCSQAGEATAALPTHRDAQARHQFVADEPVILEILTECHKHKTETVADFSQILDSKRQNDLNIET